MRKILLTILLLSLPLTSFGEIVFDAGGGATVNPDTKLSWTHVTTSSANTVFFISCLATTGSDNISSAHYNGVALSKIGYLGTGVSWGDSLWELVAPASGSHTASVSSTASEPIFCSSASYAGVSQVLAEASSSAKNSNAPPDVVTTSVTTISDNDFLVAGSSGEGCSDTGSGGSTIRNSESCGQEVIGDSTTAKTPPGSFSIAYHYTSGSPQVIVAAAIAPATTPPPATSGPTTHLIRGDGRTRNNTGR